MRCPIGTRAKMIAESIMYGFVIVRTPRPRARNPRSPSPPQTCAAPTRAHNVGRPFFLNPIRASPATPSSSAEARSRWRSRARTQGSPVLRAVRVWAVSSPARTAATTSPWMPASRARGASAARA
jgi:hypothetical protein